MMRRRVGLLQVATWTWLLCAGSWNVHAHAVLKSSLPSAAAALATAPEWLELTFNSRIEAPMTRLALQMPDSSRQELAPVPTPAPGVVRAALPALAPGVYRVFWRVLASDGHVTEGQFHFTILEAPARVP